MKREEDTSTPRRRSRQDSRQRVRAVHPASATYITRKMPPYEPLDEERLIQVEHHADLLLQEIGMEIRGDAEAIRLWKDAGATIRDECRVHVPAGLARQLVTGRAPREFVQHARNPARSVQIGGTSTVLAPAYGSPFVSDAEKGRRYGTIEDFQNFVKLAYVTPWLHHSGGTVCEPVDLPVNKRHLDMLYAHMRLSDKPFMGSVTTAARAADSIEMCRLCSIRNSWTVTASSSATSTSIPRWSWMARQAASSEPTPPQTRRPSACHSSSVAPWAR